MEKTKKIKNIFFDLCGVLVEDGYEKLFYEISSNLNITLEEFLKTSGYEKMMVGKISKKDFFNLISEKYNFKSNLIFENFENNLNSYFKKIEKNYEIITKLSQNKKLNLFIISDFEKFVYDNYFLNLNLKNNFKKTFFSFQVGFKKPGKEIFKIALKESNSKPEESIFIDDKKKNIQKAKLCGLNTILFKNSSQLEEDLTNLLKYL